MTERGTAAMTETLLSRRRASVLIVEDSPDQRLLMSRRLADHGLNVTAAGSAEEGLNMVADVDLVLLDYRLPGMSGLDALSAILSLNGPSVILMTAMGSEHVAVEAMRSGAIDYVVKDAKFLELLPEIVDRAWRHHDLTRRARQLQRLALLLNTAQDRQRVLDEIVQGALELTGADASVLCIAETGGLEVSALAGPKVIDVGELLDSARESLRAGDHLVREKSLFVRLPRLEDEPLGVLALLSDGPRTFLAEEIDLAKAFASFAAASLLNIRRLEVERAMTAELQQMIEMRRDFVSSISHELRTPLTCILGFSQILARQWRDFDEERIRGLAEDIHDQALELREIVEKVLDFADVEQGRVEPHVRSLDLSKEIPEIVDSLDPLLHGRKIAVDVAPLIVRADGELLRRVIINLLTNVVHYSDPGTAVDVRVVRMDGYAQLEVTDEGIGLSTDEQARAFEAFWRAGQSHGSTTRGIGIGLTLVREYVRKMGGDVGVRSEKGRGSTFYLTLPLDPRAA